MLNRFVLSHSVGIYSYLNFKLLRLEQILINFQFSKSLPSLTLEIKIKNRNCSFLIEGVRISTRHKRKMIYIISKIENNENQLELIKFPLFKYQNKNRNKKLIFYLITNE